MLLRDQPKIAVSVSLMKQPMALDQPCRFIFKLPGSCNGWRKSKNKDVVNVSGCKHCITLLVFRPSGVRTQHSTCGTKKRNVFGTRMSKNVFLYLLTSRTPLFQTCLRKAQKLPCKQNCKRSKLRWQVRISTDSRTVANQICTASFLSPAFDEWLKNAALANPNAVQATPPQRDAY